MKDIDVLMLMTNSLFKNGLDYEVTLSNTSKVRLYDTMTKRTIATQEANTVEEALIDIFGQIAGRSTTKVESL
jgi:hypothetical protein